MDARRRDLLARSAYVIDDDAASLGLTEQAGLDQVHRAIERLDAGTYGWCETCGRRIGSARLRAAPWLSSCVKCAVLHPPGLA